MSIADVLAFQRTWNVTAGHALELLRALPDGCIQACCSSPPYFGLRSYGTAAVPWPEVTYYPMAGVPSLTVSAQQASLGLETTLDAYVGHLVFVFREVKRVLHPTGTLWLNLGDSFGSGTTGRNDRGQTQHNKGKGWPEYDYGPEGRQCFRPQTGLPAKNVLGVPWRVAFALQADGWILRSEMIWAKKNPMPESVRDRPTRAHEQLFLFSKQPRYFYDAFAVRLPARRPGDTQSFGSTDRRTHEIPVDAPEFRNGSEQWRRQHTQGSRRQLRSVLRLASEASKIAHFAVMPTRLVRPAVLAGTSEQGCCPQCLTPYRRIVATTGFTAGDGSVRKNALANRPRTGTTSTFRDGSLSIQETTGWEPGCTCNAGAPVACCVLDPFCGAATVGLVARRYGRRFIGIELNPEYCRLARQRLAGDMPLFNEVD